MSDAAEVAGLLVPLDANMRQAEYFWRLLDRRKVEICEALEPHLDRLARAQRAGDLAGVRRQRRIVKAHQAELCSVDLMLRALRARLGLPTRRSPM
jgi:hypothetical protein